MSAMLTSVEKPSLAQRATMLASDSPTITKRTSSRSSASRTC